MFLPLKLWVGEEYLIYILGLPLGLNEEIEMNIFGLSFGLVLKNPVFK